jgi:hypothetical protein
MFGRTLVRLGRCAVAGLTFEVVANLVRPHLLDPAAAIH